MDLLGGNVCVDAVHEVGRARARGNGSGELNVRRVERAQYVLDVFRESFILSDVVVVHDARTAQFVVLPPVGVERTRLRRLRVENVLDELVKGDVMSALKRLFGRILAVASHDLAAVALPEVRAVRLRELVDVGRQEALERAAHEHHLEVVAQAEVDLVGRVRN